MLSLHVISSTNTQWPNTTIMSSRLPWGMVDDLARAFDVRGGEMGYEKALVMVGEAMADAFEEDGTRASAVFDDDVHSKWKEEWTGGTRTFRRSVYEVMRAALRGEVFFGEDTGAKNEEDDDFSMETFRRKMALLVFDETIIKRRLKLWVGEDARRFEARDEKWEEHEKNLEGVIDQIANHPVWKSRKADYSRFLAATTFEDKLQTVATAAQWKDAMHASKVQSALREIATSTNPQDLKAWRGYGGDVYDRLLLLGDLVGVELTPTTKAYVFRIAAERKPRRVGAVRTLVRTSSAPSLVLGVASSPPTPEPPQGESTPISFEGPIRDLVAAQRESVQAQMRAKQKIAELALKAATSENTQNATKLLARLGMYASTTLPKTNPITIALEKSRASDATMTFTRFAEELVAVANFTPEALVGGDLPEMRGTEFDLTAVLNLNLFARTRSVEIPGWTPRFVTENSEAWTAMDMFERARRPPSPSPPPVLSPPRRILFLR